MNQQIVQILKDPIDQDCLQITLRQPANPLLFWRAKESALVTYKGYGRHWYCLPSFKPAPRKVVPLLKEISRGPEFRHLRIALNAKVKA